MTHTRELELKALLKDSGKVRELCAEKLSFLGNEKIVDYFFRFKGQEEQELRIRKWEGTDRTITVKTLSRSGEIQVNEEFKFRIDEIDGFEKFLEKIGFRISCLIHKDSEFYETSEFSVELTSIQELGDFIEIKYHGDESLETRKAEMMALLKSLGVDKESIDSRYYSAMMLEKERKNE